MKVVAVSAACVALLAAAVFAVTRGGASPDAVGFGGPLQVDELRQARPEPGRLLTVVGVVAEVHPESGLVGLIDMQEAQTCGLKPCEGCARFTLPVAWRGVMPQPGQVLVISGRVEQGENGFVLVSGGTDD